MLRIIVLGGLHWGPLALGNYHMLDSPCWILNKIVLYLGSTGKRLLVRALELLQVGDAGDSSDRGLIATLRRSLWTGI